MKLYYFPGACSLAPHIVLHEIGLPFEIERVDLENKTTKSGVDYFTINPKGCVPAIALDNGQILTEAQVLVQYLADQVPEKNLIPPAGSPARYRVMEWLSYISADVQKGFAPLFNPATTEETRKTIHANLARQFDYLSEQLDASEYLVGDRYTVADAYLFTILNWARFVEIDLGKWPALSSYLSLIAARPAVHAAMLAERLIRE